MTYEQFIEEAKKDLMKRMTNVRVTSAVVLRNNGIKIDALMIRSRKSGFYIHTRPAYELYISGKMLFTEIMEVIVERHKNEKPEKMFDVGLYYDYQKAKEVLYGRLINTEKNKEFLEDVPHREILDLSLVYSVDAECLDSSGVGSMVVTKAIMELWGVDEETLYMQMTDNLERNNKGIVQSASSIEEEILGTAETECDESILPMYVLSNRCKRFGAVEMMNKALLDKAAVVFGRDFWLLPASIHEFILLPLLDEELDRAFMSVMVKETNRKEIAEEEILSDHLYRYRKETGQIEIAA